MVMGDIRENTTTYLGILDITGDNFNIGHHFLKVVYDKIGLIMTGYIPICTLCSHYLFHTFQKLMLYVKRILSKSADGDIHLLPVL